MPADIAPAAPIRWAGLRQSVEIDGLAYTLAAPTMGEAGRMMTASMEAPAPTESMLRAAMRDALEEDGKHELAAAITAYEAAEDAIVALQASAPPAYDTEGLRQWRADVRPEEVPLRLALIAAARAFEPAQRAAWNLPSVADLRKVAAEASIRAASAHVAICLRAAPGWAGVEAPEDVLRGIPVPHLLRLAQIAQGMLRPGVEARKN